MKIAGWAFIVALVAWSALISSCATSGSTTGDAWPRLTDGVYTLSLEYRRVESEAGGVATRGGTAHRREFEVEVEFERDGQVFVRDRETRRLNFVGRLEGVSFRAEQQATGQRLLFKGTRVESGRIVGSVGATQGARALVGEFELSRGARRSRRGPVTLLQLFSLTPSEAEAFADQWREMRGYLSEQPGFVDMELLKNVSSSGSYSRVGRITWSSAGSLESTLGTPEFRALSERLELRMEASLYEVVDPSTAETP